MNLLLTVELWQILAVTADNALNLDSAIDLLKDEPELKNIVRIRCESQVVAAEYTPLSSLILHLEKRSKFHRDL